MDVKLVGEYSRSTSVNHSIGLIVDIQLQREASEVRRTTSIMQSMQSSQAQMQLLKRLYQVGTNCSSSARDSCASSSTFEALDALH
jgi:hypothetical protein